MARSLRISYPGALYHVYDRGNSRQNIFYSDEDRFHFLRVLAKTVMKFDWVCYAYCLMSNHFHLLIETRMANISEGMKFFNGTFTQYFNWTHKRVGHLYQGRFNSILVQRRRYFNRLCRYIVMNPVKAGLCSHPGDYPWSSFNATMGHIPAPDFLTTLPVIESWGDTLPEARVAYEKYVLEGRTDSVEKEIRHRLYLGDDAFLSEIEPHLPEKLSEDIAHSQRTIIRPPLTELLESPEGLLMARNQFGYRIDELAAHLGIHRKTISRRLERMVSNGWGQV